VAEATSVVARWKSWLGSGLASRGYVSTETFADRISSAATHLWADWPRRWKAFKISIAWAQESAIEYSETPVAMTGRKRAASKTVAAV